MKIFTEAKATGNEESNISNGDLVRLDDGREVVRVKHSMRDQDRGCERNSGERCVFAGDPLCESMLCFDAVYLEKPVYLQLKLVGDVE